MTATRGAERDAAPHAPELGRAHRWLGRLHFSGVFWYRLHFLGVRVVPRPLQRAFVAVFATGFFLAMGRVRGAIASNLEAVLGPASTWERWRRAHRTILVFSHGLTDRYRRLARTESMSFKVEGQEHWREATANGRGAVLATAHVGSWEMAADLGTEEGRRVVHVVREEEMDPKAQAFVRQLMAQQGSNVVTHFAGEDPRLAIELAEALRRGELVALQSDRPRVNGRHVVTEIFGKPMPLPVGPAALARSANVALVPVFSFREGEGLVRTVVRPPIWITSGADRQAELATALTQLAREIEWAIRERPYQWYCFRKLWD